MAAQPQDRRRRGLRVRFALFSSPRCAATSLSSPGCASTPTSTNRRRRDSPERKDDRPRRDPGCPSSATCLPTRKRAGPNWSCPIGMATKHAASSSSSRVRRSGITPACRRLRSAGFSCVTRSAYAIRKPSCAPISTSNRRSYSAGSSAVGRWRLSFQESREHLGVETQRQWSDAAIARTTPALFGMFSPMTLWAADPKIIPNLRPRSTAWYHKNEPTFSDVIAAVRKQFWAIPNL